MNPEFRPHFFEDARARASDWIRQTCDFTFLFTDNTAAGFYTRLGLKRQREFASVIRLSRGQPGPAGALRLLDLDDARDYELVAALAGEREMVSERLGWKNPNPSGRRPEPVQTKPIRGSSLPFRAPHSAFRVPNSRGSACRLSPRNRMASQRVRPRWPPLRAVRSCAGA